MKKLFFLLSLFLSLLCAQEVVDKTNIIEKDKVIAIINGTEILKSELDREIQFSISSTYYHSSIPEEKQKELENEALEKLINKALIYQHAKKEGFKATEDEIKELEDAIISGFKKKEFFFKALEASKISYTKFKKELEIEKTVSKFLLKKIKADFSEKELRDYYDKNMHKFKEPEKIKLRLIYVKNDPRKADWKKLSRERAEEAYKKIKDGEDFADVAAKYSNDDTRIMGGDMGYIHKGRLHTEIEKIAFELKKGQMSEIIELDIGCFIVKVEDIKEPNQLSFDEIKDGLKKDLIKKTEKERMDKLLARLTKKAKIKKY